MSKQVKEKTTEKNFPFSKENYKLLIAGVVIVIFGFILMMGGGSDDPTQFDEEAMFSFTRITLAPFLVIAGYVVVIYAILKKSKKEV